MALLQSLCPWLDLSSPPLGIDSLLGFKREISLSIYTLSHSIARLGACRSSGDAFYLKACLQLFDMELGFGRTRTESANLVRVRTHLNWICHLKRPSLDLFLFYFFNILGPNGHIRNNRSAEVIFFTQHPNSNSQTLLFKHSQRL